MLSTFENEVQREHLTSYTEQFRLLVWQKRWSNYNKLLPRVVAAIEEIFYSISSSELAEIFSHKKKVKYLSRIGFPALRILSGSIENHCSFPKTRLDLILRFAISDDIIAISTVGSRMQWRNYQPTLTFQMNRLRWLSQLDELPSLLYIDFYLDRFSLHL